MYLKTVFTTLKCVNSLVGMIKTWITCGKLVADTNHHAESQDWARHQTCRHKALWMWLVTSCCYTGCPRLFSKHLFLHFETLAWNWQCCLCPEPLTWSSSASELWWCFLSSPSCGKSRLLLGQATSPFGDKPVHISSLYFNSSCPRVSSSVAAVTAIIRL